MGKMLEVERSIARNESATVSSLAGQYNPDEKQELDDSLRPYRETMPDWDKLSMSDKAMLDAIDFTTEELLQMDRKQGSATR